MKLLFLFLLLTSSMSYVLAQSEAISDEYESGSYLIYDCEDKHWVCVLESYFTECAAKRKNAEENSELNLKCAAIGKFPTSRSCFQRVLFLTTHNHGNRFCIRDDMRPRNLEI